MGFVHTLQMVLHFTCAQCLGIIMFYVGLRSYLVLNSNWVATHLFIGDNEAAGNVAWREAGSLGNLLDCVLSESYTMIATFSSNYNAECIGPIGAASMYGTTTPYNVFVSTLNVFGLLLVMAFVGMMVFELMKSGATNIGQGKYMAFTYKIQDMKAFKLLTRVLVVYVLILLVDTFRFLRYLCQMGKSGFVTNFSEFLLPTLLTLGFSAYSLGSAKEAPFFDFETVEFKTLQFSRGWSDIATDNDEFALQLGIALLKKKRGQNKPLEGMLQDWMTPECSTAKEVEKACDKPSEKESLA